MPALEWGKSGTKSYSLGVSKGVLYVAAGGAYPKGVAWDGLINVNESPSGGEDTKMYADNTVYGSVTSTEEFGFTIEAYESPEEFDECDGSAETDGGLVLTQQNRKSFGFCYRTEIRNDVSENAGYVIHCVFGCKAQPSERSHATINDSPEGETLSWTVNTVPVSMPGFKPTAHVKLDSTKLTSAQMDAVEKVLYGDGSKDARLPLPAELDEILQGALA